MAMYQTTKPRPQTPTPQPATAHTIAADVLGEAGALRLREFVAKLPEPRLYLATNDDGEFYLRIDALGVAEYAGDLWTTLTFIRATGDNSEVVDATKKLAEATEAARRYLNYLLTHRKETE